MVHILLIFKNHLNRSFCLSHYTIVLVVSCAWSCRFMFSTLCILLVSLVLEVLLFLLFGVTCTHFLTTWFYHLCKLCLYLPFSNFRWTWLRYIYCYELFFMLSCRSLSMWHILLCVICGKCARIVLPDFVMLHFYCKYCLSRTWFLFILNVHPINQMQSILLEFCVVNCFYDWTKQAITLLFSKAVHRSHLSFPSHFYDLPALCVLLMLS